MEQSWGTEGRRTGWAAHTPENSLSPAGGKLKGQNQHNGKQKEEESLQFLHNLDYVSYSWTSENTESPESKKKAKVISNLRAAAWIW